MEPKIEKGIPIPKVKTKYVHLFEQMEIGDSLFVDVKKSNLNSNAYSYKNKKNKNFNYIVKKENNGARIWRIK